MTSAIELLFALKDRDVAIALQERVGSRVIITYGGGNERTDQRLDDGGEHTGGAAIGRVNLDMTCTSGFTVNTQSAGQAMTTAGHCFSNGHQIESGNEYYGMAQAETDYPEYDMMLINASAESYGDDVFHDPIVDENNPLDVSGSAMPVAQTSLCISGRWSRAHCTNNVTSVDGGTFCDDDGDCTYAVTRTVASGVDPCIVGDSGAPMYTVTSGGTATIRGLLIGQAYVTDPSVPSACYGENINSVKTHLSVTVATS